MTDVSRLLESRRSRLGRWAGAAAMVDHALADYSLDDSLQSASRTGETLHGNR